MTDIIKQLDKRLEHDNRIIGRQIMQTAVLRWLLEHRQELPQVVLNGLVAHMEAEITLAKAQQPKLLRAVV